MQVGIAKDDVLGIVGGAEGIAELCIYQGFAETVIVVCHVWHKIAHQSLVSAAPAFAGCAHRGYAAAVFEKYGLLCKAHISPVVKQRNLAGRSDEKRKHAAVVETTQVRASCIIVLHAEGVERAVSHIIPDQLAVVNFIEDHVAYARLVLIFIGRIIGGKNLAQIHRGIDQLAELLHLKGVNGVIRDVAVNKVISEQEHRVLPESGSGLKEVFAQVVEHDAQLGFVVNGISADGDFRISV